MNKLFVVICLTFVLQLDLSSAVCVNSTIDGCWSSQYDDTASWQVCTYCAGCEGTLTCVPVARISSNPYNFTEICISPSPTPSVTPTSSVTPSRTPTVTPTISPSSSATSSPSVTPSNTVSPSVSPISPSTTPSSSSSISVSPSRTPSSTSSPSQSVSSSVTPSISVSKTPSPVASSSSTSSPSATTSPSQGSSPSSTPSNSVAPTPSISTSASSSPGSASSSPSGSPSNHTTTGNPSDSKSKKDNSGVAIGAAVGAIGGVALVGLVAFLVAKKRRSKTEEEIAPIEMNEAERGYKPMPPADESKSDSPYSPMPRSKGQESDSSSSSEEQSESSEESEESEESSSSDSEPKKRLSRGKAKNDRPQSAVLDVGIKSSEIEEGEKLGEGQFGVVYKGLWRNAPVIVKKIKLEDEQSRKEFLEEAKLIKQIRPHPNVVQFLGVCEEPLMIVNEYLEGGSMERYLDNQTSPLPNSTVISLIKGIASGMYHLAAENIVHRDLAARNVLLTATLIPKINDFGLSRMLVRNDAYMSNAQSLPLKWLAPESMQQTNQVYSEKSDVWSFGIVCIEILTRQRPYPELDAFEVVYRTRNGELKPTIPENCPEGLKTVLELCFEFDPQRRPTFKVICKMLESL